MRCDDHMLYFYQKVLEWQLFVTTMVNGRNLVIDETSFYIQINSKDLVQKWSIEDLKLVTMLMSLTISICLITKLY